MRSQTRKPPAPSLADRARARRVRRALATAARLALALPLVAAGALAAPAAGGARSEIPVELGPASGRGEGAQSTSGEVTVLSDTPSGPSGSSTSGQPSSPASGAAPPRSSSQRPASRAPAQTTPARQAPPSNDARHPHSSFPPASRARRPAPPKSARRPRLSPASPASALALAPAPGPPSAVRTSPTAPAAFGLGAPPADVSGLLAPASSEVVLKDPGSVFKGPIRLEVATTLPQASITEVQFQLSPPGAGRWETVSKTTFCEQPCQGVYLAGFESEERPDGLYDLRAVVLDNSGQEHASATLRDRLIANHSPVVTLLDPGRVISGKSITLTAVVPHGEAEEELAAVTFQWASAGSESWHTIAQVSQPPERTSVSFETLPDGSYDFRAVPENRAHRQFATIPARERLVDNTPPEVSMSSLSSPLRGRVPLSATATDAGSGVAVVVFERARAGSSAWQRIGEATVPTYSVATRPTYSVPFNTEPLKNGLYDLRTSAIDRAHNRQVSPVVASVEINNPVQPPPVTASVVSEAAPASGVTILGNVSGGEGETWAFGFTKAPPAQAPDGTRLPYTAEGDEPVLLRHTERAGWQITDVLRCPPELAQSGDPRCAAGGAFKLLPADRVSTNKPPELAGAMTSTGEAWLWLNESSTDVREPNVIGLFHRLPGGSFELDAAATASLRPLLDQPDLRLRLGQGEEGSAYGILTAASTSYGILQNGHWSEARAPAKLSNPAEAMKLVVADVDGPGAAWGAFEGDSARRGLILGHLSNGRWSFVSTGLDALDLTRELEKGNYGVRPQALKADKSSVWIEANVNLGATKQGRVVARYDGSKGEVTNSWCTLPGVANSCEEPLDLEHPAAVPDAIFHPQENTTVALSLGGESVHVFANGAWSIVAAPGHGPAQPNRPGGGGAFTSANEGWLGGAAAVGHWTAKSEQASSSLASWPLPDRAPLMSVAVPPGAQAEVGEAGALAVGLHGTTLRYDPSAGWLVQPVPPRARRANLLGVAYAGASSAFAVGQQGVILHWDGSAWSEDPQSRPLTNSQLNAVAFSPSGEGWAVGGSGTILHYDGHSWSRESPPSNDEATDITSVAVAGADVYAVAGGNLITRGPAGWEEVSASQLPSGAFKRGELRLVAGLPDGGVVAAGRFTAIVREAPTQAFQNASQPLPGIAVALAPFRQADGRLRTYASVAPPVPGRVDVDSPPGDGELVRESDSGWQDLSHAQFAGSEIPGDGAVKNDPVLAVATGPTGEHAWAVGGYAGSLDAAQQGTLQALVERPAGWMSASIWRYDTAGSAQSPALEAEQPNLPSQPGTVAFAFFSSPTCRALCAGVPSAQPDVNLATAAAQIATYGAQPGGPAFAMLGGEARGPLEAEAGTETASDFARLPSLLAPLGQVPLFAALGRRDNVHLLADETRPWAEALAEAPPPFGSGTPAAAITPVPPEGAATPNGLVHRYYAFDAHQNGATLRVVVLDNSRGSLEASAAGQTQWLETQLANAQNEHVPVVAISALPLRVPAGGVDASDGYEVASLLASKGVLAVFTTNPAGLDERYAVPCRIPGGCNPGSPASLQEGAQIPEYEGASLGYQKEPNHGVKWYSVRVDTQASEVHVDAIPIVDSLSLKPLDGLSVARSLTLRFEAIGRRPSGTLATKATESPLSQAELGGYDNYVEIPAPSCGSQSGACVPPSYSFTSSDPTIGDFVVPSGPESVFPKLNAKGHPIPSSTSGLFCAYNSGTTTVSVTAGILKYSLPVTVQPGGFGAPCGTVTKAGVNGGIVHVSGGLVASRLHGASAPPPPPSVAPASATPAPAPVPPPPPAQAPHATPQAPTKPAPPAAPAPRPPAPAAAEPLPAAPLETLAATPTILPAATPPVEPIPPGASGYAQSPAAAKRKEEARKHASQSAFVVRAAGSNGDSWFYAAVGVMTLLALVLSARSLRPRPRPRPALLEHLDAGERHRRRR